MEYLIRKQNGTTVRVSREEYERILSRVAEGERADKLVEKCQCGDRRASQCPEPWEPGCDLGNNEAHVRAAKRQGQIDAAKAAWAAHMSHHESKSCALCWPVAELGERRWGAE